MIIEGRVHLGGPLKPLEPPLRESLFVLHRVESVEDSTLRIMGSQDWWFGNAWRSQNPAIQVQNGSNPSIEGSNDSYGSFISRNFSVCWRWIVLRRVLKY